MKSAVALHRHEPAHPEVAEAAQLRAGDLVLADAIRDEPDRDAHAGNRVLLHAHLEQPEAVDDVLARQVHEHRPIDRQIQLIDRRDVVLRVRVRAVEAERVVRADQLDVGAAEHAVGTG